MGRVTVTIGDGGMVAKVEVLAGASADHQVLASALQDAGVMFGVDEEVVETLAKGLADVAFSCGPTLIARGQPAIAGIPERVELDVGNAPAVESARTDYRSSSTLISVTAGRVLGRFIKAEPEQSGTSVTGALLPAEPARAARLPTLCEGVAKRGNGDIIARCGGVLDYNEGKQIDIISVLRHTEDVDFKCGHLETGGELVVSGSVTKGFACAGREIEIGGSVVGGSVFARNTIIIKGMVQSAETAIVSAGESIRAGHVKSALVECGGELVIDGNASAARLHAKTVVIAGKVVGGTVRAEKVVSVKIAGSPGGVVTILAAGMPLERPLEAHLPRFSLAQALAESQRKRGATTAALRHLAKSSKEPTSADRERHRAKRDQKRKRQSELQRVAYIDVQELAHVGTVIMIGNFRRRLEKPLKNVRFRYDESARRIVTELLARPQKLKAG